MIIPAILFLVGFVLILYAISLTRWRRALRPQYHLIRWLWKRGK